MPTTLNFVAAVGRTGDGANAARPRIESVCAKYRGKVVPGGAGSSDDPIKVVFEDTANATLAAKEAFGLDDVEDVRVDGTSDITPVQSGGVSESSGPRVLVDLKGDVDHDVVAQHAENAGGEYLPDADRDGSWKNQGTAYFKEPAHARAFVKSVGAVRGVKTSLIESPDITPESTMKNAPTNETLQGDSPTADDIAAYKAGYRDGMAKLPAPANDNKAYVQGYDHGLKLKVPLFEGEGLPKAERPVNENIGDINNCDEVHTVSVHVKPGAPANDVHAFIQGHLRATHGSDEADSVGVHRKDAATDHPMKEVHGDDAPVKPHTRFSVGYTSWDGHEEHHARSLVRSLAKSPVAKHIDGMSIESHIVHRGATKDHSNPAGSGDPVRDPYAFSAVREHASAVAEGKMDPAAALDALLA